MVMKKNTTKFFFLSFMMVIILTSNTACAGGTVTVPDNTAAILFISENGKVIEVNDAKGMRVQRCALPGQAKRYAELPVCKPIPSIPSDRGEPIDIFFNSQNPCYITIFIAGQQVKIPVDDKYCPQ